MRNAFMHLFMKRIERYKRIISKQRKITMSVSELSVTNWNNYELSMYLLNELGGGTSKNRDYIANLTSWLSVTPKYTVYRVNTLSHKGNEVKNIIHSELSLQASARGLSVPITYTNPAIPEIVVMDSWNVSSLNLSNQKKEVIVDIACGIAVLRGAHVFAPGVKGMCSDISPGDFVSVYADIENKCTRGLMCSFTQAKYFVGNGIVRIGRKVLFGNNAVVKGVAIEMTDILSGVPSLSLNCIPDSFAILQNLPSVLCCKVLNPLPGERVLDMCAAPGNKTTHLAMLMHDEGTIIAIDKTRSKLDAIKDRCQQFGISCVKGFVYDSTKAVRGKKEMEKGTPDVLEDTNQIDEIKSDEPPFCGESFDRILLDAPCSAMGQRPQISGSISMKQLKSYPSLQQKLFQTAIALLRPGGHLVYSTCTVTVAENELLVKWALDKFPCIDLVQIDPTFGGPGLENVGLTDQQQQCVRRFGPPMNSLESYCNNYDYNQDTVGFFIAHFIKK